MKKILLFTCLLGLFSCADDKQGGSSSSIALSPTSHSPTALLVEGLDKPLNVHNTKPRLSWQAPVATQSHYQIQVASQSSKLDINAPDLWDSGKIAGRQSLNIAYGGDTLDTNDTAYWRVRVWQKGASEPENWSDIASWEMGLLNKSDWQAKWLQAEKQMAAKITQSVENWMLYAANIHENSNDNLHKGKRETQERVLQQLAAQPTASLFRHEFSVTPNKTVVKARLHSTAAGYYEIFINGKKVDDRLADPGQTDYDKRILYNTDDVLSLLGNSENILAVHLGSGWYDEAIAFSKWNNPDAAPTSQPSRSLSYGQPKFIAQLELTFDDGSTQVVATDKNWLSHPSPVLKEGLFSGEMFDARQYQTNWHTEKSAEYLANWQPVQVLKEWPTLVLEPQLLPPIRANVEMKVKKIYQPREKVWVLDFGQNFTGIPTLHLNKLGLKVGQAINLRYAEWADVEGNISQKTGGGAPLLKQVDTYVAADATEGNAANTWTPVFTWHGFRYIEITGLEQAPDLDAITAHLVRSDVARVGKFSSSNALVNLVHDMALWSYESNLMALPMDCPIRERAGWTGDAHAALITGNYNYNLQNFWDKYLGDFRTSSHVAPAVVPGKRSHGGKLDWAAAEVMIAWEHYRHYGDLQLLASQYDSMLEYMTAGEAALEDALIRNDRYSYGDWCDPVREPGMTRKRCNSEYTAPVKTTSALLAHSANLMAKMSELLNKPEKAKHFSQLFSLISQQYHQEFYNTETGSYGSQTADAMALQLDIAPQVLRQSVADALNKDVLQSWNGHGSVGAIGQTYLYKSLSDYGYGDTAFNIFTAQGYPGYQWQFDMLNATTLWERKGVTIPALDPMRKKPPGRSLNHPFHSGYDGWFYEGLGGIRLLEDCVGYQDFALRPVFPKDLDSADVSYTTGYGEIISKWKREGNKVIWQFSIPNNSTALVSLPNQPQTLYKSGEYTLVYQEAIK
ncbi:glycoside hydrolase family 78 protein [Paraglaciecola aquimarina]|uniref:alpha-L-rhamnosidase n=1 Tax=Paraglaciecola algarum TaxID=3050085 RepID=A0ABS9D217_9ALTE|nr:alpha-L-rhamnosidase [Paraglaciecola sp. G1-23]MCF2946953.1 glycoside hydrolase family 78 protein [Paraglaciecola sp. G1-23]